MNDIIPRSQKQHCFLLLNSTPQPFKVPPPQNQQQKKKKKKKKVSLCVVYANTDRKQISNKIPPCRAGTGPL